MHWTNIFEQYMQFQVSYSKENCDLSQLFFISLIFWVLEAAEKYTYNNFVKFRKYLLNSVLVPSNTSILHPSLRYLSIIVFNCSITLAWGWNQPFPLTTELCLFCWPALIDPFPLSFPARLYETLELTGTFSPLTPSLSDGEGGGGGFVFLIIPP